MEIYHAMMRLIPATLWLALIWTIETCVSQPQTDRVRHGIANLAVAAVNGLLLFFTVGLLSIYICDRYGTDRLVDASSIVAFVGLDLFGYFWHRANHRFRFLWRFHAVHHSDNAMDVTTSGRFHFMELGIGALIRLPVLYMLGVSASLLVVYETTLVAVSMFHHSTIRLGRWDPILRAIIVTPAMHSVHHSRDPVHFEHNFSSVFSIWDRLFGTFWTTTETISHGLNGRDDAKTHCVRSMLAAPFQNREGNH